MQKLALSQSLQQKLSPQQIQFLKLLEVPTAELDLRIEDELEQNPALEEGLSNVEDTKNSADEKDEDTDNFSDDDSNDLHLEEYLGADDKGYKMADDSPDPNEEEKDSILANENSLYDSLVDQLNFLGLSENELFIGNQIIGSIDEDGYLHRKIDAIVNDMAFTQNIQTNAVEVLSVLYKIQEFEPAGIAARDLQECLLLQLNRKTDHLKDVNNAITIVEEYYEEFTKKHYDKIEKKNGN